MLFSEIGISVTMLTLLVANQQNIISQIISFSVGNMSFLPFMFINFIFFHNGSSRFSAFFVDHYIVFW
jgi:hypothetical protein